MEVIDVVIKEIPEQWSWFMLEAFEIAPSIWFALAILGLVVLMQIWLELRKRNRVKVAEPDPPLPLMLVAHANSSARTVDFDLVNLSDSSVYVTNVTIRGHETGKEKYDIYKIIKPHESLNMFHQSFSSRHLLLINRQEVPNQLLTFYYFQGKDLYESDSGEKGYVRSYDCHALKSGEVMTFPLSSMSNWIALEEQETVNNKT